jgi:hypothetical protein
MLQTQKHQLKITQNAGNQETNGRRKGPHEQASKPFSFNQISDKSMLMLVSCYQDVEQFYIPLWVVKREIVRLLSSEAK